MFVTASGNHVLFPYSIFLYPWFPPWEEAAKIFGVHGLLYEEVHLAGHAEHCTFFHSFKFLLKSYQNTLCHFIEQLVFITEKETRVLGGRQILIHKYKKYKIIIKFVLTLLFCYIRDQHYWSWSWHQLHLLTFAADIKLSKDSWSNQKEGHIEAPKY